MKKLLAILLLLSSFLFAQVQKKENYTMSMTDINGTKYTATGTDNGLKISGMEGKIVFLEFFGHNCPPCLASIPHLTHLKNKYKDRLAIIAIEVQGYNTAQLKVFAKAKGMNYTVISEETAYPLVNYLQQRAQWHGSIPFLVVLDPKGDVQFIQVGMLPEETLDKIIQKLSPKQETKKASRPKRQTVANN